MEASKIKIDRLIGRVRIEVPRDLLQNPQDEHFESSYLRPALDRMTKTAESSTVTHLLTYLGLIRPKSQRTWFLRLFERLFFLKSRPSTPRVEVSIESLLETVEIVFV